MPRYSIEFTISGHIEVETETSDEAYEIVKSFSIGTLLDNAEDITYNVEDPEL